MGRAYLFPIYFSECSVPLVYRDSIYSCLFIVKLLFKAFLGYCTYDVKKSNLCKYEIKKIKTKLDLIIFIQGHKENYIIR